MTNLTNNRTDLEAPCSLGEMHGSASTLTNEAGELCCDFCGRPVENASTSDEPINPGVEDVHRDYLNRARRGCTENADLEALAVRHTPGPWWVAHKTAINSNPHNIARAYFVNGEANARLIALAPDLFDLVQSLDCECDSYQGHRCRRCDLIAKVHGQ